MKRLTLQEDNVDIYLHQMVNYGAFFCVGKGCPESNQTFEVLEFPSRNILNIVQNSHLLVKLNNDCISEVLGFFFLTSWSYNTGSYILEKLLFSSLWTQRKQNFSFRFKLDFKFTVKKIVTNTMIFAKMAINEIQ